MKINSYEYTSAVIVGDKISIICIDEEKTKEKMFTYSAKDNEWYCKTDETFEFKAFVCLSTLSV